MRTTLKDFRIPGKRKAAGVLVNIQIYQVATIHYELKAPTMTASGMNLESQYKLPLYRHSGKPGGFMPSWQLPLLVSGTADSDSGSEAWKPAVENWNPRWSSAHLSSCRFKPSFSNRKWIRPFPKNAIVWHEISTIRSRNLYIA